MNRPSVQRVPPAGAAQRLTGQRPTGQRPAGRRAPAGHPELRRLPARPNPPGRGRASQVVATVAMICLAAGAVAGLGSGLVSCGARASRSGTSRPVTGPEAQRLAAMRLVNYRDHRVGFRAMLGTGIHLTGWVDWQRPLIYANSVSTGTGAPSGLVQATPGVLAVWSGRYAPRAALGRPVDPYPAPPLQPPADGWRVGRMVDISPAGSALNTLLTLLFALAAPNRPDPTALAGARFLRRDLVSGVPVDVISGPALPSRTGSPAPVNPGARAANRSAAPFADSGGEITSWLDDRGGLRRLDALLAVGMPLRVDFRRDDHTAPVPVEFLGGAAIAPRAITAAEAHLLAGLPGRDRAARSGRVTVVLPAPPAGLVRADGWLDWRVPAAYLAVRNQDDPSQVTLLHIDPSGIATRTGGGTAANGNAGNASGHHAPPSPRPTPGVSPSGGPPAHPPTDGWRLTQGLLGSPALTSNDLDILLYLAITASGTGQADLNTLERSVFWLRTDSIAGTPVTVFEMRTPDETEVPAGAARLRYWVDRTGVLRRIEVRTASGTYGYLDIAPGPVPPVPSPRVRA